MYRQTLKIKLTEEVNEIDNITNYIINTISVEDIILCISVGFIFLGIFRFIVSNRDSGDFKYTIIKSLIIGFILKSVVGILPFRSNNNYVNILFFILFCILLSFILAKLYSSTLFEAILRVLGIRQTVNPYIWTDIEDKENSLWVIVGFKELDLKYFGILAEYEDFNRKPQIVLGRYIKCKYNEDVYDKHENDFSKDPTQRVLLDTEKADIIELVYNKKSNNIIEGKEKLLESILK